MKQQKRYLEDVITSLCFNTKNPKMAFIAGPRQAGKTTCAKHLLAERKNSYYHNWDDKTVRKIWAKDPKELLTKKKAPKPLIIFDEIHKAKGWKRTLKGLYDTLTFPQDIVVTGSTKLNTYRKSSDSLMGRYYYFRLHPFSLSELTTLNHILPPDQLTKKLLQTQAIPSTQKEIKTLEDLMTFGPFPEPYLAKSKQILQLWQMGRVDKVVNEELRDLSKLPELNQISLLVSLLPERVGNPISITTLREDLEVAYTTIKRWLTYLEALYYHYEIKPYTHKINRSLKKEGKLYLWDWSEVENEGSRFENLIASHLFKYCDYLVDTGQSRAELRYVKTKEKKELDFVVLNHQKPFLAIEVKLHDESPSSNWKTLLPKLNLDFGIQVVKTPHIYQRHIFPWGTIYVMSAEKLLKFLA